MTNKCNPALMAELQHEWLNLEQSIKALCMLYGYRQDESQERPKCIDFTNIQNIVNQILGG